jgi:hypothetical protein
VPKPLKRFVKQRLFDFFEALDSFSSLIQKKILHMTLADRRSEQTLQRSVQQMDQDLLNAYSLAGLPCKKAVRYKREPGSRRGEEPMRLLRIAPDEWYRRGYPRRDFTHWVEENLADFHQGLETNEPQVHSEKELPL